MNKGFDFKSGINIQKSYTLRTAELVCRGTEQINAKLLNIYICMSIGLNRISVKYHRVFFGNLTYSFDILYSSYFIIGKHNTYKYGIGSYTFFKFFQRHKTLIINIKIGDFISQALKVGAGIKHGRMLYFRSYYMLTLCFISRDGQFNSPIIRLGASGGKINLTAVCRKGICYNFSCHGNIITYLGRKIIYSRRVGIISAKIRQHSLKNFGSCFGCSRIV